MTAARNPARDLDPTALTYVASHLLMERLQEPLADLLDATAGHRLATTLGYVDFSITEGPNVVDETGRCWCTEPWPCSTARARDAVVAALEGDQP